jgi:phage replication-related protein YjqB (UPF0714/DUF867 family)
MAEYPNFAALSTAEKENKDFRVLIEERNDCSTVILAPHGGGIEPGTSEIAKAIAGPDLSLADFAGIKSRGNAILHITSTNFDEPRCTALVEVAYHVLAVHGEDSAEPVVYLGGKDFELGALVREALARVGFTVKQHPDRRLQGLAERNICNRNKSRAGVQLELSRSLREKLFQSLNAAGRKHPKPELIQFANAVREGLRARKLPESEYHRILRER